jgi:hypothetical protein
MPANEAHLQMTLSRGDAFQSETEKGFYLPLFFVVLVASIILNCAQQKPSAPDSKPEGRPAATAPAP